MQQSTSYVAKVAVLLLVIVAALLLFNHTFYGQAFQRNPVFPDDRLQPDALVAKPKTLSAAVARKIQNEPGGMFLGNGTISPIFAELSMAEGQALFHAMKKIDYMCKKIKRFGHKADGGYDLCLDPPFEPKKGDCLVYSFGINRDWSFDEAINSAYGCEVHSFDPSIGLKDHMHRPNMHFHNLGVWGWNMVDSRGWKLMDLNSIVKQLGHSKRVIDMLKFDVEGAEWPLTRHIADMPVHKQIKQVAVEWHTPRYKAEKMSFLDFAEIYSSVHDFEQTGFKKYAVHEGNMCCGRFAIFGLQKRCCYEGLYINSNYIT